MSNQIILGDRFISDRGDKYIDPISGKSEDYTIDYLENVVATELGLMSAEYDDGSKDYIYSDTGELAFIIC